MLAVALLAVLAFASCGPAGQSTPKDTKQARDPSPASTALDEYVAALDPSFSFDETPDAVVEGSGYTASVYLMTSQEWLDPTLVDKPAWKHWVTIVVPDEVTQSEALLVIGGGANDRTEPPKPEAMLGQIAVLTKSVLVVLPQIPSEPLKFPDEQDERYKDKGRTEDEIIAYGWDKFLITGDPIWLLRLPMTKAAVRAMDMVQELHPEVDGFVVVGGSKRGWTTWTTGAVDERVKGIVPAVIDVLNVAESLNHHWAAYGFWAPAITDYEDMKILARLNTPEFAALEDVVDPYTYIDRLTMPKYIVSSAGDQFFLPDSWRFYYDDLQGEKHVRYIPNTDHGMNADAYFGLAAFHYAVINNIPRPVYNWRVEDDGAIVLECETAPSKVTLWQATNPDARDFRLESLGPKYESSPLDPDANGVYRAAVGAPDAGWTAFLIELEFPCEGFPMPFKFSTGISVVPDTLPHKDTPQPK
ncbi:MAG: PhoPQ-activated pathogenicity [bacterium]|nr:PhoPQ-activated pathogenicity [bacterium]